MIDILLATYNGEKYLQTQIESILQQTMQEFRIIVRDDNSTDKTCEILAKFEATNNGKIIVVHDNKRIGNAAGNFFELLKYAEAEYVMFCDQDDFWFQNKIEASFDAIKQAEATYGHIPILAYGNYIVTDENLIPVDIDANRYQIARHYSDFNRLLVQNYVSGCLTIMNRELYRNLGEYDERIMMHDWWAALYASAMGKIVHFSSDIMLYRQHNSNCVGAVDINSARYIVGKIRSKSTKCASSYYYNQAKLFEERYYLEMPRSKQKSITQFIDIANSPHKCKRIYLLIKGKYYKSTFIRILGQLYYI